MAAKTAKPIQLKVEDIGGVFIYANDAKALTQWYNDKLGMELSSNEDGSNNWLVFDRKGAPPSVFAIKPATTKLPAEKSQFMLNFRINDFEAFLKRLQANGVALDRTEEDQYGRFGWIKDLEGNPVEFWQPK
jgi:catechol 2,3-dioxygenase-like lactoylglutathione lyase family enzyme